MQTISNIQAYMKKHNITKQDMPTHLATQANNQWVRPEWPNIFNTYLTYNFLTTYVPMNFTHFAPETAISSGIDQYRKALRI